MNTKILIALIMSGVLVCGSTLAQEKSPGNGDTPIIERIEVVNSEGEKKVMTTRMASFFIGKNLAYQAALGARGFSQEELETSRIMTKRFADALGVELGEIPRVKDFGNLWAMFDFMNDDETGVGVKLAKAQNKQCASLARLSYFILSSPSFYSDDLSDPESNTGKINQLLHQRLAINLMGAKLEDEDDLIKVVKPLIDHIEKGLPGEEIGEKMKTALSGVEVLLAQEAGPTIEIVEAVNRDGETKKLTTRMASFFLGKELGLIGAMGIRDVPAKEMAMNRFMAKQYAGVLQIVPGQIPELKDASDIWAMRNFVMDEDTGIASKLLAKQNKACAALAQLGHMLILAPTFYSSDFSDSETAQRQKEINEELLKEIFLYSLRSEFRVKNAGFEAIKPVFNHIKEELPADGFTDKIIASLDAIEELLDEEFIAERDRQIAAERKAIDAEADEEYEKNDGVSASPSSLESQAKELLESYVALSDPSEMRAFTLKLQPTAEACQAFIEGLMAVRAEKVYRKLFSPDDMVLQRSPDQTEIKLRKISSDQLKSGSGADDFPGGYKKVAPLLKSGVEIFEFSFVKRGETRGMRYDGLVKIGDQWFLFPKLWRLLDERPFGIDIK